MDEIVKNQLAEIAKQVNISGVNLETVDTILCGVFLHRGKENFMNYIAKEFGDRLQVAKTKNM